MHIFWLLWYYRQKCHLLHPSFTCLECAAETAATKANLALWAVPSTVRCQPGASGANVIPIVPTAWKIALLKWCGWPALAGGPVPAPAFNMPCATTRVRIFLGWPRLGPSAGSLTTLLKNVAEDEKVGPLGKSWPLSGQCHQHIIFTEWHCTLALCSFRCVEKTKLEPLDVPSHYCDPEEKPSHSRDCQIYCPGECVVSEWTEWSSCLSVRTYLHTSYTSRLHF